MRLKYLLCMIAAVCFVSPLGARDKKLHIISRRKVVFKNTDCARTQSCGLKKVMFVVEQYRIGMGGGKYNYGSRLIVSYKTASPQALKQYAFVQFIKGCSFAARLVNGAPTVFYYQGTVNYGKRKPFTFPHFVIDSGNVDMPPEETDPLLTSAPGHSRFFWCRLNDSTDGKTRRFLMDGVIPAVTKLYIIDHPGETAYFDEKADIAYDISLELRTCVYLEKNVPRYVAPDDVHFSKPIFCFRWRVSWIYDFHKGTFENPLHIVPACRE